MSGQDSFVELMTRLRAGDEEAASAVFQRFAGRLIALAHTKLDERIRRKVDPEDVVQSVYKSFFARYASGQLDFGAWNDLWSLLTVMTVRKCVNRLEYFRAQRRNAASEVSVAPGTSDLDILQQALAPDPSPEEAMVLTETVEQLLRGLGADDRSIIELSLQGCAAAEISTQLGLSQRTVRRVRERVKQRLQRMQTGD